MLLAVLVVERGASGSSSPQRRRSSSGAWAGRAEQVLGQVQQVAAVAVGHGAQRRRAPRRPAAGRGRSRLGPLQQRSSAASSSRRSTSTWQRDSSAPFSSNDGFSVVAPTRVTMPSSTKGRKPSCWARLKRWISSTNSRVALAGAPALPGVLEGPLQVGDAGEHRRERANTSPAALASRRAMVVLPEPGGPHRIIEASWPRASMPADRPVRAEQVVLADHLLQRLRPQPVGERARAGRHLGARGWWRGAFAEQVGRRGGGFVLSAGGHPMHYRPTSRRMRDACPNGRW